MGYRLSKIYTRTGDAGTTGLANGARVEKTDKRIEAFGAVDETNSVIGLLLCEEIRDRRLHAALVRIQNELFDVGAELSLPGHACIAAKHVEQLETDLDAINAELPALTEFVLPGGNRSAAVCHMARTSARRAERELWHVASIGELNPTLLQYMNRLSDFLFVAARSLARQDGGQETLWQSSRA
jgi:cob(I)alamin adenosyltransferase